MVRNAQVGATAGPEQAHDSSRFSRASLDLSDGQLLPVRCPFDMRGRSECNSAGVSARPRWPVLVGVGVNGRTMDACCCPVKTQNSLDIRTVQSRSSHAGRFWIISSRYCGHGRADLMGSQSLTLPRSTSTRARCGQGRSIWTPLAIAAAATRTRCRREAGVQVEVPADRPADEGATTPADGGDHDRRSMARTCRWSIPMARSRPSSRTRSRTDGARYLTMPNSPRRVFAIVVDLTGEVSAVAR
jgi:hypothetical protein